MIISGVGYWEINEQLLSTLDHKNPRKQHPMMSEFTHRNLTPMLVKGYKGFEGSSGDYKKVRPNPEAICYIIAHT